MVYEAVTKACRLNSTITASHSQERPAKADLSKDDRGRMCIYHRSVARYSCGHLRLKSFLPPASHLPYLDPTCRWASLYAKSLERWELDGRQGPKPPNPCEGKVRVVEREDEGWSLALRRKSFAGFSRFDNTCFPPPSVYASSDTCSTSSSDLSLSSSQISLSSDHEEVCERCRTHGLGGSERKRDVEALEKMILGAMGEEEMGADELAEMLEAW